jgi:DUF4097 and DUF4098 domain-containing protein YvlB
MPRIHRAVVILAVVVLATTVAFAREQGNFDRTLNVNGPVDLEVTTGSGDIVVSTGGDTSVQVNARVTVNDSWLGSDNAREKLNRIIKNPPIAQDGNTIRIGRILDPSLRRNVSISYSIVAPAATTLRAQTGSGNQTVEGVKGTVTASTGSGDLRLARITGDVRANTGSGNIVAKAIAGAFSGNTGSGNIEVQQAAPGRVSVQTGSGNAVIENVVGALHAETGSGDITASGRATAAWDLRTGSGNVTLDLPQESAFQIEARTSSGDIKVDHPLTMQGSVNRHEVRGTVRGGGALLAVRTGSGDIRVR